MKGWVEKRTRNGRTTYRVRYLDERGKERTKSFSTKRDAKTYLETMKAERRRGTWVEPTLGQQTFGEYVDAWRACLIAKAPGTQQNINGRLDNHVIPCFGPMALGAIQPVHVRAWVAEMQNKGLAPGTLKSTYRTLVKVLRTAEIDRLIVRSPCVGVELPKETAREEMCFLDAGEVDRLAAAIDPRYSTLIFTAAYTGMRWGELAGLRVERVELPRGVVHVVEAVKEVSGTLNEGATKSGKARSIAVPRFLAEMLGEHIGRYPSVEGRVFSSAEGTTLRRSNFYRRHYKPAVRRAGLPEGLRFHDLRHTCAALLIALGAHAKEIQERLGHSTIQLTFDRYGHLLPSLDERLREGLERTFWEVRRPAGSEDHTQTTPLAPPRTVGRGAAEAGASA